MSNSSLTVFRKAFLPLLMVITSAGAQTQAPTPAPSAAAAAKPVVVGEYGVTITAADLEAAFQRVAPPQRPAVMSRVDNLSRQSEELYLRRVLAIDAEKAGLEKDPVIQAQLRQARERILSDAQVQRIEQGAKLADDTVRAYARDVYRSNPKRFEHPAQTRARHILIARGDTNAKERAAEILKRIRSGESFEELAAKHSADYANSQKGGDLGFFAAGTMVAAFEDAVSKLAKPGDVSDLVETEFGFHIVRLEARRPAGTTPFEEIREALEREVRLKAQQEARQARIDTIQRAAKVDVPAMEALAKEFGQRKP